MPDSPQSRPPAIFSNDPARGWTWGFLLAGMLMGALGSLLVAWQYQLDSDPRIIGVHFLALNGAVLALGYLTQKLLRRFSVKTLCIAACFVASAGFVELSFPLFSIRLWWRVGGVMLLGMSAGTLLTCLFHVVRPYYEESPVEAINVSGLLFGAGCLAVTVLIGISYPIAPGFVFSMQWDTICLAIVPLVYLIAYLRHPSPALQTEVRAREDTIRRSLRDLRSIAAVLFSLLLFFQFGSEWALAGWLPLFLIHRLGMNPASAIFVLAIYFLALLSGRLTAQLLLTRIGHTKLLAGSVTAAMFGYLALSKTNTIVGAGLAAVVTGLAFAPIYALVAEKIGRRFEYHPGFFNGIFSLAITGGMLAPWLLGYVGYYLGMSYVMLIPAFGSVAVLILMLLIILEAKLMGSDRDRSGNPDVRLVAEDSRDEPPA
jgi:fucose permease